MILKYKITQKVNNISLYGYVYGKVFHIYTSYGQGKNRIRNFNLNK